MKKDFSEKIGLKLLLGIFVAVYGMVMPASSWANPTSSAISSPKPLVQNNIDGSQTLLGYISSEITSAKLLYQAYNSEMLNLNIMLPVRNQAQLTSFLQNLYNPQSPGHRQWLTPAQFTILYGYSGNEINYIEVKNYLQSQGFIITGHSANGLILHASADVFIVQNMFKVRVNHYQKKEGALFFANDRNPTLPIQLAGKVVLIGGLDNLPKFKPLLQPVKALAKPLGTGPLGFLTPNDVKTAYNLTTIPSNGSGQTVALFELDGYVKADITQYETNFNLPNVSLQNIYVDGFNGTPNYGTISAIGGAYEVTADIELLTAFTPGSNILVYEGPNTDQAWIDEWTQIASDNKASIVSCSWGSPEGDSPMASFDNATFQQMAAQGQAVFVAAGDSGAFGDNPFIQNDLDVLETAAQPYATGVGISTLTTNPNGTYNSEAASIYGGGGISGNWSIPGYQVTMASQALPAAMVSTSMRNVPDVVLTADSSTGYALYINGAWSGLAGSSLSTPIWASFMSMVNQGLGSKAPLGFANPALYQIAQSSSYAVDFHAITTGNNGYYPAEPGYNDATGLGSFNGLNLYNDLLKSNSVATVPPAPTGLSVSINSKGWVNLTWSPSSGALSYNIKRSTSSGGPYTTIASQVVYASYTDTTAANNTTYYYVVSAVDLNGESVNSTQVNVTLNVSLPPVIVLQSAIVSPGQVFLAWQFPASVISFNVKRSTSNDGPYTTIASGLTTFGYVDTSVANGTTYYYVVSAVNIAGEGPNSNQLSAVGLGAWAPSSLTAECLSDAQVSLDWGPGAGAVSYNVLRSTSNGGPYTTIANSTTNIYTDNSVVYGTTYYYVIAGINASGQSADSNQASATPEPPPQAPTDLVATAGNAQVSLTWNASLGATSYNVFRSVSNDGPYKNVDSITATNYTDTTVANGTTYYYYVIAQNTLLSAPSNRASATPQVPLPRVPTGLTIFEEDGPALYLTWSISTGATSYNVLRSTTSGGPYTTIGNSTVTNYLDNSVAIGTIYYYVVQAVNASGASGDSNETSVTIEPPLSAPTNLVATAGNGKVQLTWNAGPGDTQYDIFRSTSASGQPFLTSVITATNYVDTSVVNGTTYYYAVAAFNDAFLSPSSNLASATPQAVPPPETPTGLTATAGTAQVNLTWNASTGATSYHVNISTTSGGPYTMTIGSLTATSYTDRSVIEGTTYYYVVSAVNASGESPNSAQVSATPGPPAPSLPEAVAMETPTSGTAGVTTFNFNASASTDPGGTITSYLWNFADGATGSGISVSHVYTTAGSYGVSLMVKDNRSLTNTYILPAVTVVASCTPTTCAALGDTCGSPSDGCRGTLSCGSCSSGQTCSSSFGGTCVSSTSCATINPWPNSTICSGTPNPTVSGQAYTVSGNGASSCTGAGACTAYCNPGYYNYTNEGCFPDHCATFLVGNAQQCSGTPTPTNNNQTYAITGTGVGSCTGTACTAYCNPYFAPSGGACVCTLATPAAPQNPRGSCSGFTNYMTNAGNVSLAWNPIAGVNQYDVTIYNNQGQVLATPATDATVLNYNLAPGQSYSFVVNAVNSCGVSSPNSAQALFSC